MRKFTKESTTYFVQGLVRRWNVQKVRSESSVESYFEEHAQEVWERNWMSLEMQTTLLNAYLPKLIATMLKALRELLKESGQLHSVEEIARPIPEIHLEHDQIL